MLLTLCQYCAPCVGLGEILLRDLVAGEVEGVCWTCSPGHHTDTTEESPGMLLSYDLRESLEETAIFRLWVGLECHHSCLGRKGRKKGEGK